MKYNTPEKGFTMVEMLVTIVVAGMFIVSISALYIVLVTSIAQDRNRANASDIAYSYLRKYASANSKPTWFTCSTASGSSNTNDSIVNPNAAGQVIESGSLASEEGLPTPITYKVTALAVFGCNGSNINKPLNIKSEVTYGPNNTTVSHATILGY